MKPKPRRTLQQNLALAVSLAGGLLLLAAAPTLAATGTGSAVADLDSRNYTLTVASAHGNPTPAVGTHTYAWRATVSASVEATVTENGTNYVNTGWTGTGSVPETGDTNATGEIELTELVSGIEWGREEQAEAILLAEDFEDGALNPKLSVTTVGTFNTPPGIYDQTFFGGTKAFTFGYSTASANAFDNFETATAVPPRPRSPPPLSLAAHHPPSEIRDPRSEIRDPPSYPARAALRSAQSSSMAWGTTFTSARTGMKFVSPLHRGTIWPCRWDSSPAPAAPPRLKPRLNPSGRTVARSARTPRSSRSMMAARSSGERSPRSATCRRGATSRCPLL